MYIDVVNDTDNVNVFVQVDKLAANPDAYNVLRCLEAYLLLLFGCVLVNNTHEDIVDMVVLPYARTVVVATAVPVYNSGCWQRLATPPTRAGPNCLLLWSYQRGLHRVTESHQR
jgi:hypothetical protein